MGNESVRKARLCAINKVLEGLEIEHGKGAIDLARYLRLKEDLEFRKAKLENELGDPARVQQANYNELKEWKELHNLLQDLQNGFAICRSHIINDKLIKGQASELDRHVELFEAAEINWQPCQKILGNVEALARAIDSEWFDKISESSNAIDDSFKRMDTVKLPEQFSVFGDMVDRWLYRADKKLRELVND